MTSSMLRRQLKNLVQNYSEAEVKVREATSNDPWGPSSSQMADISDLTYNVVACNEIMTMLWKRLKDDRNWRHIHKSLTLLEYLLKTGDDRVLLKMKDNIYIVKALTEYRFVEKDGKDQGANVREKAKVVLVLMEDDDKLKEERDFAVKTREKTSKSSAASSADTIKDVNYKPCYVPGATGLPSLDNIPSVADLTAAFTARKEERLKQEAEKKETERRAKLSEDELKWEDAAKGDVNKDEAWGGEKPEEEGKPDPWGAPEEPKEATDPWGTPSGPSTSDTTTASSDPWGGTTKTDEDSFETPRTEDPFSKNGGDPFTAPKDDPDPFTASVNGTDPFVVKNDSDPFTTQKDDPFSAPKDGSDTFDAPKDKEDPFAAPKDKADPFSSSNDDPFNTPKDDAFNAPKDDPFNAPVDDPFNTPKDDPFNAPKDDPFNAPKDDPFNTPKDEPFNAPKDDPFNAPKDDPFNAPKDDPFNAPKDDPFNAPKDDPFTTSASSMSPKEDPFAAPKPTQDDPFPATTTPPKEDPFSAPSEPTKDDASATPTTPPSKEDPFAAPSTPPKEDPFTGPSSRPKDDTSDPFSSPPLTSPQGSSDVWGAPASSPPTTGPDPWGAPSTAEMETKGGDPWGDGTTASAVIDNSDPFGDGSKPDTDPWGAPASAPASTDDAWGTPAPQSGSSPSDDPFGDGASKSSDPWGAPSSTPSDGAGKQTAQEEMYRKTASFLGSAGASLVDFDDLFSSNSKQRPLVSTLTTQTQAIGTFTVRGMASVPMVRSGDVAGVPLPETSARPGALLGSIHVPSYRTPTFGAANPSREPSLFQPPSCIMSGPHSDLNMFGATQSASLHLCTGMVQPVGGSTPMGLPVNLTRVGVGLPGFAVRNPLAEMQAKPVLSQTGVEQPTFFGGNPQAGVLQLKGSTPQAGGGVSSQPQLLSGSWMEETTNRSNNPFLL